MNDWVAASQLIQNAGVAIAALVGSYLAWKNLRPTSSQAEAARIQADLLVEQHTHKRRRHLDLNGAFIRRTDLSGGRFVGANLSRADATGALFDDADLRDANLDGTILIGANLSGAKNLTVDQLAHAVIDQTTILPDYIDRGLLRRPAAAE